MSAARTDEPWRQCFRELAPKLLLFARQWVRSQTDAEDVVQTAFIRFWRRHPDATREHFPLLFAAVRTIALDQIRGEERRIRRENHPDAPVPRGEDLSLEAGPAQFEQSERAAAVEAALDQIPPEQREVVVLKIWGDLTFQQVAELTGAPLNTVAARYRYAIEKLRERMTSHERI